ncbi:aminotransferase [Pisolithus marmoratus]|nr:aminotransferase [Pisolithus marmoratus]
MLLTRLPLAPSRLASTSLAWLAVTRHMSKGVGTDPMTGEAIRTDSADIEPSLLTMTRTTKPRNLPPSSKLLFGRNFSDHMLKIRWTEASGWDAPSIEPYAPLSILPSATVLHYAQAIFEGLKAYRRPNGTVTMFRPDKNMERMNTSAQRLALPTFNGNGLIECIRQLVALDRHWIPKDPGHSLYIRPTLIGTNGTLGVQPPSEALLFVICSPAGPYYPQGFKPVPLYGTTEYIRAAPGGTGAYKLAANYAPGVIAQRVAAKAGYAQNLWLHGPEHYLTEVGTMNLFVALKGEDGATELVTPPLDGMILPGITRDSVLALARNHVSGKKRLAGLPDQLKVSERPITMGEVKSGAETGRLVELFGAGTACVISPVEKIGYLGSDVVIPTGEDGMGPLSRPLWTELTGIQAGEIESEWNFVVTK